MLETYRNAKIQIQNKNSIYLYNAKEEFEVVNFQAAKEHTNAQDLINFILENYQESAINYQYPFKKIQENISVSQNLTKERFIKSSRHDYYYNAYDIYYDQLLKALMDRRALYTMILNEDRSERANLLIDFMLWIEGFPKDKIQKHISQYLCSLNHDPGELFDNQTRLIYADLSPKQQNQVFKCGNISEALREQRDVGPLVV